MPTIRQTLSYLILGQKGSTNRIRIIELLRKRPYNLNQMAEILDLNYRTVKHHVGMLVRNELVSSSKTGGYGEVYFLTPEMEGNMDIFDEVIKKLTDFTASPKFFRDVVEQTNDAVIITNMDGEVFFWNKAAARIFGYSKDDVMGRHLELFEDDDVRKDIFKDVKKGKDHAGLQTRMVSKEGTVLEVSLTVDPIRDEPGEIIGFSIMCRDVTRRKAAEDALKLSEERYMLAQRAAGIGSWDWDIESGELHWSDTIEPMFGFGNGEFGATYEAFLGCVHPDDRQHVVDSVNDCIEKGSNYHIEHRIVWPDGSIHMVSEDGDVIRDKTGKAVRMLGVVQDITERKQAERVLREHEEELDSILDKVPIPLFVVDGERVVKKVNAFSLALAGVDAEKALGLRAGEVLRCENSKKDPGGCGHSDDCAACLIKHAIEKTADSKEPVIRKKVTLKTTDHETMEFLISTYPLDLSEGEDILLTLQTAS